ncbi:MAG: hypothetical protein ABIR51_09775 [Sphingomicrobium sp.]
MILVLLLAMAGAPSAASINAPRRAFSQCIKAFETDSLAKKIPAANYAAAVKGSCTAEATSLRNALIAFDVAMGTKRSAANANAQTDLDDYYATSNDRYQGQAPVH